MKLPDSHAHAVTKPQVSRRRVGHDVAGTEMPADVGGENLPEIILQGTGPAYLRGNLEKIRAVLKDQFGAIDIRRQDERPDPDRAAGGFRHGGSRGGKAVILFLRAAAT